MSVCQTCGEPATGNQRHCSRQCSKKSANDAMVERLGGTRARTLWFNYHITLEEHNAILAAQNGRCAICETDDPGAVSWCVDHDHACCPTKAKCCGFCIRGLLCDSCNRTLGVACDSPERLRRAAEYLEGDR